MDNYRFSLEGQRRGEGEVGRRGKGREEKGREGGNRFKICNVSGFMSIIRVSA